LAVALKPASGYNLNYKPSNENQITMNKPSSIPGTASLIEPASNPKVEHKTRAFLQGQNSAEGKRLEQLSPQEARDLLSALQASAPHRLPPAYIEHKTVEQEGLAVSLTIVRPANVREEGPAFLFFHGGGFVLGDFPTHELLVRDLVLESEVAAIFVNYTRSPEAQYPTAINEAYAATKWVAAQGEEINVDRKRLAVVGNSAGANIAAATALKCNLEGGPALKGQVLFCPVTDANFETPSYNEYAEGYSVTKSMMKWFWDHYCPDLARRREVYASPLQASIEQLKGLPPAHIQVAGNDVLRDEGVAYARKLDAAGVEVTLVRYDSMIHDYCFVNHLSRIPVARTALHQAAEELKRYLKQ
jgi:acetyl esterase/lipase